MTDSNIEIAKVGDNGKVTVLTPSEVRDYLRKLSNVSCVFKRDTGK